MEYTMIHLNFTVTLAMCYVFVDE